MAVKITDYCRKNGQLLSATVQLQDARDKQIFVKFLEGEPAMSSCPHCGKANIVGEDDYLIRIDNPLGNNLLNLNAATPIVMCDHCKKPISLSMLDYSAFPSVVAFIQQLKARSIQKAKEKKGGA